MPLGLWANYACVDKHAMLVFALIVFPGTAFYSKLAFSGAVNSM